MGQNKSFGHGFFTIRLTRGPLFGKNGIVDLEKIRHVGLAAACGAGEILLKFWGKAHTIEKKGAIDLVTEADVASEKAITRIIGATFPEHSIHAEESGVTRGMGVHRWIIDPLDGTTNYSHNLPEFSVSIAFAFKGQVVFGLVLNPVTGELFCATKGQGATLNGKPIHVSRVQSMDEALLATGFPYDLEPIRDSVMKRWERCLVASQGIRRLGSAALDLCYVACGRFEGFWEQNLAPWDTAAGMVIAQEAGAAVSDFSNEPYSVEKKEILATNGLVHEALVALLRL